MLNWNVSFLIYWVAFDGEIKILKSGFRISPPRIPSSGWISIKKSKSGFHSFPFYRSIGKSKKGFAKLFSWTAVLFLLIMCVCTRPLRWAEGGEGKIRSENGPVWKYVLRKKGWHFTDTIYQFLDSCKS